MLSKFANKSFFLRLGSGICLIALILGAIIPGGCILLAASFLVSLIGVFELYRVLGIEKRSLGFTGYLFTLLYYLAIYYNVANDVILPLFALFLICLLAQYVFTFPNFKTQDISNAFMGMIYAGVLLSFIYFLRDEISGQYFVWLIFLSSWGSDTCAYVAGVAFGKHKMAPVLSPKKSIEGAVGGVIGAAALRAIYGAVFSDKIALPVTPVIAFAVICAIGALVSMVGDLAASAIKRDHEIKDYSNLIPGHGGIMDRFDSVIYVAPVIWVLLGLVQEFFF